MNKLLTSALVLTVSATLAHAADVDISGELRFRGEARANVTESSYSDAQEADTRVLSRARVNFDVQSADDTNVRVTIQDSRVVGAAGSSSLADSNDIHIREAFIDHKLNDKHSFKLGRQSISFGKGRVIGDSDFSNTGQAIDALRVTMKPKAGHTIDVFGSKLVEYSSLKDNRDTNLYGIYSTNKTDILDFDIYYVNSQAGLSYNSTNEIDANIVTDDQNNRHSIGFRGEKKISNFELEGEVTFQIGVESEIAGVETTYEANAYDLNAKYNVGDARNTAITVGYASATGDDINTNDANEAYKAPLRSKHKFNGISDIYDFENLSDISVGVSTELFKGFTTSLTYHKLDKNEGTAGNAETDLGSAIDIEASWACGGVDFDGGVAFVLPGDRYGSDPQAGGFGYLAATAKF